MTANEITEQTNNRIALIALAMAKVIGIVAVVMGFTRYRIMSGTFLGLAFVLLAVSIGYCIKNMRLQKSITATDIESLERMVREGTLKQYLKDLKIKAEV